MMGSAPMGGPMRLPDQARRMAAPAHWLPCDAVQDVDAKGPQAQGLRAGGRSVMGRMEVTGGERIAGGLDPQGAAFAVHARAAQAVRPPAKKKKAPAKNTKARAKRSTARKTKPKRRR